MRKFILVVLVAWLGILAGCVEKEPVSQENVVPELPVEPEDDPIRLVSLDYIPEYSDWAAMVEPSDGEEKGTVKLMFQIYPPEMIPELDHCWKERFVLKGYYTRHRSAAMEFFEMPLLEYESDAESALMKFTASGCNLSEDFYRGDCDAAVVLEYSDSSSAVVSSERIALKVLPPAPEKSFTVNGAIFKMIRVEGGSFLMGGTAEQGSDADASEFPVHEVRLSSYYIGQYEVTQELWKAVMGENEAWKTDHPDLPVAPVSWKDIMYDFLPRLNEMTGMEFALPTEAQWEYAARGGNASQGYKFSGGDALEEVGWCGLNSEGRIHPVGTLRPNELGLYDMSGNVYEWCLDWWGDYTEEPQVDPIGPENGKYRVLRGGSKGNLERVCRVSYRYNYYPGTRYFDSGFRLVCQ